MASGNKMGPNQCLVGIKWPREGMVGTSPGPLALAESRLGGDTFLGHLAWSIKLHDLRGTVPKLRKEGRESAGGLTHPWTMGQLTAHQDAQICSDTQGLPVHSLGLHPSLVWSY